MNLEIEVLPSRAPKLRRSFNIDVENCIIRYIDENHLTLGDEILVPALSRFSNHAQLPIMLY